MTFTVLFSALIGGFAAAVFTFDVGGGWALCLLAYSLGGSLSLFAAALCHAGFPDHAPVTRHPSASAQLARRPLPPRG